MKHSRRYYSNLKAIDRLKNYDVIEGVDLLKKTSTAKFDESVEISVNLGVNPKYSDQMVRGTVILPHGTGKKIRVLVLTQGEKVKEAEEANADYVGLEEYIKKIQEGWFEFDVLIVSPDVMRYVGKLGKILGPKGLMPNPKSGTVTNDIGNAVKDSKAGKISFRVDRYGIVHSAIGKASFDKEKLVDNLRTMIKTVMKQKPIGLKGQYMQKITLSSSQGPGIRIDKNSVLN
ncbi:MAG: 50S ribosomal protein L1 [Candidatus Marinimicrobia bacterium]|nr:50S ribosomal protein L1 [Candidatus Neomarinimicrobiota bacterium]